MSGGYQADVGAMCGDASQPLGDLIHIVACNEFRSVLCYRLFAEVASPRQNRLGYSRHNGAGTIFKLHASALGSLMNRLGIRRANRAL